MGACTCLWTRSRGWIVGGLLLPWLDLLPFPHVTNSSLLPPRVELILPCWAISTGVCGDDSHSFCPLQRAEASTDDHAQPVGDASSLRRHPQQTSTTLATPPPLVREREREREYGLCPYNPVSWRGEGWRAIWRVKNYGKNSPGIKYPVLTVWGCIISGFIVGGVF